MTRGDPLDRRGPPDGDGPGAGTHGDGPGTGRDGDDRTDDAGGRDGRPAGRDGELHVYTGNGKGKTTAAFGAALRAVGHGWRVHVVQFMKGEPFPEYGEVAAVRGRRTGSGDRPGSGGPDDALAGLDGVTVEQHPVRHLVDPDDVRERDREAVAEAMAASREALHARADDAGATNEGGGQRGTPADAGAASPPGRAADARYDLVVLDEVNVACHFGLADPDDVVGMLADRRAPHAVCTGRYAPDALVEAADLVTRLVAVRHPRGSDGSALEGIDW